MSDEKWYLKSEKEPSLGFWIFRQMTMGAAYAALVCMAVLFFILIWRALAEILPEDPFAALETVGRVANALA